MIKAANFDEAHRSRYLLPEYPAVYLETHITNLIADFRDAEIPGDRDGGQALVAEYGEGIALTHAHPVDQWQIYLTGVARLTRKPVAPVVIQYTDAWVPYGPIEVGSEGFALIALWPRPNIETYEVPKQIATIRENLRNRPARRNLLQHVEMTGRPPTTSSESQLCDEADQVWARRWQLPARASLATPDPRSGGGQFFIPLSGTVEYEDREYPRWSAIYVGPHDHAITVHAGAEGVDLIGVQFRPQDHDVPQRASRAVASAAGPAHLPS